MTTDYNKTDGPLPTIRKQTGHNLQKTQSPLPIRLPYPQTYALTTEFSQTSYLSAISIPTDPHPVTTTDIKTNMRHIHILSLGI